MVSSTSSKSQVPLLWLRPLLAANVCARLPSCSPGLEMPKECREEGKLCLAVFGVVYE